MASITANLALVGDATAWVSPAERFYVWRAAANGGSVVLDVRALGDADAVGYLTDEVALAPGVLREVIPAPSGNKQFRLRCAAAPSAPTAVRIVP